MSSEDRRAHYRFNTTFPVRYAFAKKVGPGKYQVSAKFKGRGTNFSGGGAAITIGKPVPANTLMYVEMLIEFHDGELIVPAAGVVTHRQPVQVNGKNAYTAGFHFLMIDERNRDRLSVYLPR